MMISRSRCSEAFVWIWLPGQLEPVVAGKLTVDGEDTVFNYGRSYLDRNDAIPIDEEELPLRPGVLPLVAGLHIPNCIQDAGPDAWGQRVIMNKLLGTGCAGLDSAALDDLTYLLESGSDRIGALDFQLSPTMYEPRTCAESSLEDLAKAAEKVELGIPLSPELDQALIHGSSIGGARPKVLITGDQQKFVAKFSSHSDPYQVVKGEYIAMRLAALAGMDVAPVSLTHAWDKEVLLVERFDRHRTGNGWLRKHMVSALTLFGLEDVASYHGSYETLADIVRRRFRNSTETLRELFSRMVFNVLCGNTDDHARNHAAFWDGESLQLTPAYDICPQRRTGNVASQVLYISGMNKASQVATCLDASASFRLTREEATEIAIHLRDTIRDNWDVVCDEARMSAVDRAYFWGRQFLNPYSLTGLE